MKKRLLFLFVLSIIAFGIKAYGQSDNYFNLTFVKTFSNGQSNQVSYINFPNVSLWGWVEITITGGYNHQLNKGKLTKRFAFMYNAGGYFNQSTEIPTALGELATQWNIGDYDKDNNRIPIYHLTSTGNDITIEVEGVLQHTSSVNSIETSLSISNPVIVSNSKTRQYTSIMQSRVGIGTLEPQSELEVNGAITLDFGTLYFDRSQHKEHYKICSPAWDDGLHFHHYTSHKFFIGGNEKLRISQNGNVLIGKTTQQNSNYKLDVAGSIRADEIKVNLDGADFVFESDYKLSSLKEVESYIQENKRLPGIVSADEMSTKGADLGELNTKLLQKIEELTLYIIEQNKKIEDMQNQINELKD